MGQGPNYYVWVVGVNTIAITVCRNDVIEIYFFFWGEIHGELLEMFVVKKIVLFCCHCQSRLGFYWSKTFCERSKISP